MCDSKSIYIMPSFVQNVNATCMVVLMKHVAFQLEIVSAILDILGKSVANVLKDIIVLIQVQIPST